MIRLRAFSYVWPLVLGSACTLRMQPKERPYPDVKAPLPSPTAPATSPRPTPHALPLVYKRAYLDTLVLPAGRVLTLHPATRTVYERLPAPLWLLPEPSEDDAELDLTAEERKRLRTAGPTVQRVGHTLWLRPGAARPVRLLDNPAEDYETNIAYEYLATIPAIKQWLIAVHLYEGGYFMLVDQRTGHRTAIWSPPSISPDNQHFVCGNSDVLAHYEPSGLQVWATDGPRLHKLWERQTEWGVSAPRWLDNRNILFEQDYLEKEDVDTRVVRLTVVP